MLNIELGMPINIVGPCAAESEEQVLQSGAEAKRRGFKIVRSSLPKPRTRPGWDGVGTVVGAPWLAKSAEINGIIPATEVINGRDAHEVINEMDKIRGAKKLLLWIGSRNQVHWLQQEIGSAIAGVDWVSVGIKNPMGPDEKHWLGVIDHLLSAGASLDQLLMIHRGFVPNAPDKNGLRNVPNWKMVKSVREISKLPMIIDTSHIGGRFSQVLGMTKTVIENDLKGSIRVDGLMVEIHPDPKNAATDQNQQLSWMTYDNKLSQSINGWVERRKLLIPA